MSIGRLAQLLVLVAVVAGAAWWSGGGRRADLTADRECVDRDERLPQERSISVEPIEPIEPGEPADIPENRLRPLPCDDAPYHGLAWQIHRTENCVELARRLLGEMADLGADTVLISNAGYQEHAGSAVFRIDPAITPSEEQWLEIFALARANNLRVILMPIILLSDPRGNEWRGVINPPNWDDWFAAYRDFLLHFARIAQRGHIEAMLVGSELISTEKYTDRWRSLIADVRKVFDGKLSYSANWDHYRVVQFWDALDLVGMTSYYKLSSDPNPSLESLVEAWQPIKRGILRWQRQVGKPLLFTEVGWCSQEGTSIEPWNYYYHQTATEAGLAEQANCYRAFMRVWDDVPEVGGVIWWEWDDTPGGPTDYNYTPRGKPAEKVLREWFAAQPRPTPPTPDP